MVLFFVIALALGIVLALVSPEALESETMWEWIGLAYISVWILIFYYRLYRHFQGLSGTGTTSLSSVAAN